MKRDKFVKPKKTDYPNQLKALAQESDSTEYHQLIEASASAYFETKGMTRWLFMKRFKTALSYLGEIEKVSKLLDAGTGIGYFLPSLAKQAAKVMAIDSTDFSLKYARSMARKRKLNNINFKKMPVESLDFKDNQFEVIVCMSVLEHVLPKNLDQVVKEFKRILKPGGVLIAGFPNEGSSLFKVLQTTERFLLRRKAFKAFKKDDRETHQTLGHVSTAKQIEAAINKQFKQIKYDGLPVKIVKLYCMGLFRKNW